MNPESPWLDWAIQIQSIAKAGEIYSKDKYDKERFEQLTSIANQMLAFLGDTPVAAIEKIFIPETGHPTPKVDLRAGIVKDNQILLIQENEEGGWSIPGGWGDIGMTPSEGITHRVLAQTGLKVENPKLICVRDRSAHPYQPKFPFHVYKLYFVFDSVSEQPVQDATVPGMEFFSFDDLPPLAPNRVLPDDIELIAHHFRSGDKGIAVD
ncbi:NUDIX hydrolase N-terminal domain-containing protein [Vibrio sp. S4M6]|uniref:NUDIX hydrolase n=1 Tax=Vibrio sinus TaxID=2946865 RepID=UPI002029C6DE|nr:NUDIX hydrolase N-terminal domain-containing protein [Vibrio sinus]MCL9782561.1 NUDIX hydrolase N-terminal domain-containing protein [Vibrio sinus]